MAWLFVDPGATFVFLFVLPGCEEGLRRDEGSGPWRLLTWLGIEQVLPVEAPQKDEFPGQRTLSSSVWGMDQS